VDVGRIFSRAISWLDETAHIADVNEDGVDLACWRGRYSATPNSAAPER
jgi:hypothetical protein